MLWLGIFLPRLPLEVVLRGLPQNTRHGAGRGADSPVALCDRLHVLQANEPAQLLGITDGMKRATALALAGTLQIFERKPAIEREALRQIAVWALQFTPSVSIQSALQVNEPIGLIADKALPVRGRKKLAGLAQSIHGDGLLLEIQPSLKLFSGFDALLQLARQGLHALGFSAQMACAPTATAAWLLARHQDGLTTRNEAQMNAALARLPVSALDSTQAHLDKLEAVGIHSIGELLLLPRAGLARRFGSELLLELDRALGKQADPRSWFEAPAHFNAQLELFAQVDNAQNLWFGACRLLVQLSGWLSSRHAAVQQVQLAAEHDDLPPTPITLRLSEPSRELNRLQQLLREHLAILQLPAPVHTLRLQCEQIVSLAASNTELFPVPASMHESLGRLIERLKARLGPEQVQRLMIAQDHRPEFAYRIETGQAGSKSAVAEAQRVPVSGASPQQASHLPQQSSSASAATRSPALPRPLWLLPKPVALTERNHRPYWHGELQIVAGPERIESGWWDNKLVQRDYFIASDQTQALLWIYRERLADADSRQGWFLQGRFG